MGEPIPGEIRLLAGNIVPPGWAACNGQTLQVKDHRELFSAIGTTYGGDGKTTFQLPDLRGRVAMHSVPGRLNNGMTGGEAGHKLTTAEIPSHAHGPIAMIGASNGMSGFRLASNGSVAIANGDSPIVAKELDAKGTEHDNLQPYLALNFVIALHGVWPSRR